MIHPVRLTKPRLFALLMFVAALGALLPTSCTRWAAGVLQPLGWITSPLASAGRAAADGAGGADGQLSPEVARALRAENELLRRQVGQQSLTVREMEARIADLTSIREQFRDPRTRIRIATVLGYDTAARRETLLIARGGYDGIVAGQWVVACSPTPQTGDSQTAPASGRDVVIGEWLIGRVSEVFPFVSRVRLSTDPQATRERVRVARVLDDGGWEIVGNDCLLIGAGDGMMRIVEATADLKAGGGEIVIAPQSADLPTAMTLGRIVASRTVPDAPLYFNLDVRPWDDVRRMSSVYVIIPGRDAGR